MKPQFISVTLQRKQKWAVSNTDNICLYINIFFGFSLDFLEFFFLQAN